MMPDKGASQSQPKREPSARKPWATPRVIRTEARDAGGGTSVTTIDFTHVGTYFAS